MCQYGYCVPGIPAPGIPARGYDAAGNVADVGRGAVDVYNKGGLTLQNSIQIAGGSLGVLGDYSDLLGTVGKRAGGVAPRDMVVGSGLMGDIRPATMVRQVNHGEQLVDLQNELKRFTFQSRTPEASLGLEHAIISKTDGTRWLVSGGEGGIDFANVEGFKRMMVHTHGLPTGPSLDADIPFLISNGQKHGYIIELGNPDVIRFNSNGTSSTSRLR